jgi:serine/threonine protein kinase
MEVSIQTFCNALVRSQLLAPAEVRSLFHRWRAQESGADDAEPFCRWLVVNEYLTAFQADRLMRGQGDNFFLNQYKILDRIGRGPMAGVYKAVHRLGQVVAIKVLPPSRAKNPQIFARFQREARLAKRLDHPNLVRTYQTAVAGDDLFYLVMEYLEGETLKEVLERRGRLPPAEAVRLVHQALLGLKHIHEQSLVHRDLEPGNLMLVPAPAPGQPDNTLQATLKILDIGLGRAVFDESVPAAGGMNLTVAGTVLGTPEYMAPEQAKDAHAVDIRADIYSLGCILYHCLTGQPPFPDKDIVRTMIRHATEPPALLKQFDPQVPDGLQPIVDRMLAKDPDHRYQTPALAAQALQAFQAGGQAPGTPNAEPRMSAYLQWLAANARDDDAVPAVDGQAVGATPRGWLLIGIGAGVVVTVAAIGWLLVHWLFG